MTIEDLYFDDLEQEAYEKLASIKGDLISAIRVFLPWETVASEQEQITDVNNVSPEVIKDLMNFYNEANNITDDRISTT